LVGPLAPNQQKIRTNASAAGTRWNLGRAKGNETQAKSHLGKKGIGNRALFGRGQKEKLSPRTEKKGEQGDITKKKPGVMPGN